MPDTNSTCSVDGCTRPLANKASGLCMTHYQKNRRANIRAGIVNPKAPKASSVPPAQFVIPQDIIDNMSKARTTEDWQNLGEAIAPIMASIMSGNVLASAAQVSLIKDIMNRAYGKPVATQTEKKIASGIIILPALDTEGKMTICPRCEYDITKAVPTKSDDQS